MTSQAYKPPHYITLGFSLLLVSPKGRLVSIPMDIEEITEDGLEAMIVVLTAQLVTQGFRPPTAEEYQDWALRLAEQKQRERLHEAVQEWTQTRAVDPARVDAILAAHKGREGGDA